MELTELMISQGFLPWRMPRFYESVPGKEVTTTTTTTTVVRWKLMLVAVFVYYMLSCGIERIYQPMVS